MSTVAFHISAQALLEKQIELTRQLYEIVKKEYDILNSRITDALETYSVEKQPLIVQLDQLNQQWLALLEKETVSLHSDKIKLYLEDYDSINGTALKTTWQNLVKAAKACQKANEVNGRIISLRYQATMHTLQILRGNNPDENIYNGQGARTSTYAGGHELAKA